MFWSHPLNFVVHFSLPHLSLVSPLVFPLASLLLVTMVCNVLPCLIVDTEITSALTSWLSEWRLCIFLFFIFLFFKVVLVNCFKQWALVINSTTALPLQLEVKNSGRRWCDVHARNKGCPPHVVDEKAEVLEGGQGEEDQEINQVRDAHTPKHETLALLKVKKTA